MLRPYLEKFKELNKGSVVVCDSEDDNTIANIFVCPNIMNGCIRYVRPGVSLDAAHLKSKHKGTLFSEAPVDYLRWIVDKAEFDAEVTATARYWLDRGNC